MSPYPPGVRSLAGDVCRDGRSGSVTIIQRFGGGLIDDRIALPAPRPRRVGVAAPEVDEGPDVEVDGESRLGKCHTGRGSACYR